MSEHSALRWRDPIPWLLSLTALVAYYFSSTGEGNYYNYHVHLANALLHGRLDFGRDFQWLELVEYQGKYFTVFPPGPALLALPFVAIQGMEFYQPFLSIFAGAISTWLSYHVFFKLFGTRALATSGAIVSSFGSIQWYHAQVGSGWYVGQILAITFIWAALLSALHFKNFFWTGVFIGGAYLCRLPTVLNIVMVPILFWTDFIGSDSKKPSPIWKNWGHLILGLIPALLLNGLYNYLRFGAVNDVAYDWLPIHNEPWYVHGLFSHHYVLGHLQEMFLALPRIQSTPPYVLPSVHVMAIWITMPCLFLAPFADFKSRLAWGALAASIFASLPGLFHGGNGFTQFGFRFSLDYLPPLMILVVAGMRRAPPLLNHSIIALSVTVNLWGVIMISHLKKFVNVEIIRWPF